MGPVLEPSQSPRRFHYQHDFENHSENRLLVTDTHGSLRSSFLSHVVERSTKSTGKLTSLVAFVSIFICFCFLKVAVVFLWLSLLFVLETLFLFNAQFCITVSELLFVSIFLLLELE